MVPALAEDHLWGQGSPLHPACIEGFAHCPAFLSSHTFKPAQQGDPLKVGKRKWVCPPTPDTNTPQPLLLPSGQPYSELFSSLLFSSPISPAHCDSSTGTAKEWSPKLLWGFQAQKPLRTGWWKAAGIRNRLFSSFWNFHSYLFQATLPSLGTPSKEKLVSETRAISQRLLLDKLGIFHGAR